LLNSSEKRSQVAVKLVTGSVLVNAHILYGIIRFKEEIALKLQHIEATETIGNPSGAEGQYNLKNMNSIRRRCVEFYETLKNKHNRLCAIQK
ncbi:hypothetical protein HHI36_017097, partial [Cryptolaemus montrouzieri]